MLATQPPLIAASCHPGLASGMCTHVFDGSDVITVSSLAQSFTTSEFVLSATSGPRPRCASADLFITTPVHPRCRLSSWLIPHFTTTSHPSLWLQSASDADSCSHDVTSATQMSREIFLLLHTRQKSTLLLYLYFISVSFYFHFTFFYFAF